MIKVKMLDTNEIVEVTANVAHGLVDSGKAVHVEAGANKKWYETREMRTSPTVPVTMDGEVAEKSQGKRGRSSKTYHSK